MNTIQRKAHTFLTNHSMGVLSTASDKATPWGAAVYYALGDDFSLYFLTRAESKKYRNMHDNPHAAFTVVDNEAQATVQMVGSVREVPLGDEQNAAFAKLASVHTPGTKSWSPPISKMHTEGEPGFLVMRLTPQYVQFADFKDPEMASHHYVQPVL